MTHSQTLRWKIDIVRPDLSEAAGAIWNHARLAELFPDFLFTVHSVIRATVPTMQAASEAAALRAASDPVAAQIAPYLAHHAREERNHDEWMLDDLKALGVNRDQVIRRMPSPAVAALVGSQYYWVHHYHPVAYLSYIAVLEGPPSVEFLEQTLARTGLPREAFGTQFLHARLDVHHVRDFDAMLDGLPLERWHEDILGVNAFHTVHLLRAVYQDLVRSFEESHSPAAAIALG